MRKRFPPGGNSRNTYTPEPTDFSITGTKVLEGRAPKAGEFTFRLEDTRDNLISEAVNDGDGKFSFEPITYDKEGVYTYQVREVKGDDKDITYDDSVCPVYVTVEDDKEGHLTASAHTTDGNTDFVFTNTWDDPEKKSDTPVPVGDDGGNGGGNGSGGMTETGTGTAQTGSGSAEQSHTVQTGRPVQTGAESAVLSFLAAAVASAAAAVSALYLRRHR